MFNISLPVSSQENNPFVIKFPISFSQQIHKDKK